MSAEHVIVVPDSQTHLHMHCEHCGSHVYVKLPIDIEDMRCLGDAYAQQHKDCIKDE